MADMSGLMGTMGLGLANETFKLFGNYLNAEMADYYQTKYMEEYGGIEAQLRTYNRLGVNPFKAVEQISGNSGNTVVTPDMAAPDPAGSMKDAAETAMNLASAENTEVDTAGKQIQNDINSATVEEQKATIRDNARKVGADADTAEIIANNQEELSKATIDEIKSKKEVNDQTVKNLSKQVELYDKQIEDIDQQIAESKARENLCIAEKELTEQKKITEGLLRQKMQLEIDKGNVELDLKKHGYDTDPIQAEYERRYENAIKQGKTPEEATAIADKWFEHTQDLYKKSVVTKEEATFEGNPVLKSKQEIIDYYEPQLVNVENEISDLRVEMNSKKTAAGRYMVQQKIKVKEAERKSLIRQRNRQLRRFDKGATVGGQVLGTGVTVGG